MADLIPSPDLDIRDEEFLAAQAIAFTAGPQTPERIDFQIGVLRQLRALVTGGALPPPVCPELTNANASSPHTVLLEAQAWLLAQLARRVNRLPEKVRVEFARLFRAELREAAPAVTTLRFAVAPPAGQGAVIPAGTAVTTEDESHTFLTSAELALAPGQAEGDVAAERDAPGATVLAAGTLTRPRAPVAWVAGVTNPEPVESGADAETVEAALARARNYQVRGERLVTAEDYESAILDDVLGGSGVVRAFPLVRAAEWQTPAAGHMTVVVMTASGGPVGGAAKRRIAELLSREMVGNIFPYVEDPEFEEFEIEADVRLTGLTPQSAIIAGVAQKLRSFYAATHGNFGKSVYQSDIIGIIEGSDGVERIERRPGGELLARPAGDVEVAPFRLPKLLSVTLNPV